MESEEIRNLCKQQEQLLIDKYFSALVSDAADRRPETIEDYSKELPLTIAYEYRTFLEGLWHEHAPREMRHTPLVLEEEKLLRLMTEGDQEAVDDAFRKATEQTLWERMTKSNHRDVTYYKGLLQEYTRDMLMVMREDFLEEITGHDIENKAFE